MIDVEDLHDWIFNAMGVVSGIAAILVLAIVAVCLLGLLITLVTAMFGHQPTAAVLCGAT